MCQVLACSLLGTALAVAYVVLEGEDAPIDFHHYPRRSYLLCAYLGHYACCNGDTWWVGEGDMIEYHHYY